MERREEIVPAAVYTLREVCQLLRIGQATARRWLKQGKLPRRQVGRGYRFLGKDLLNLLGEAEVRAQGIEILEAGDPLLALAGTGSSGLTDVSERHDDYLAEATRRRNDGQ